MGIIRGLLAQAAKQAKGVGQTALRDARSVDNAVGFVAGVRPSTVGLGWTDMLGLTSGHFKPGSARAREADNVGLLLGGGPAAGLAQGGEGTVARALLAKARIANQVASNGVPAHAMGIAVRGMSPRLVATKGRSGIVFSGGDITFQRMANVAQSGKARAQFVKAEQSAGHAPWVDRESMGRMAVLVDPEGRRVLVGQPGLHHHDVAQGAGLNAQEALNPASERKWLQGEIHAGEADLNIRPRVFLGGYGGNDISPRQAAAVSRFLKNVKGARYGPLHK